MSEAPDDDPGGEAPDWGGFLRALMEILEAHLDDEERSLLLRAIGARLAATAPLPAEDSLAGLESRINERLAGTRWGSVTISLDSAGPALVLTHQRPPYVAFESEKDGHPLGPVLVGLHGGWIGAQPGADAEVEPQLVSASEAKVVLRYGV